MRDRGIDPAEDIDVAAESVDSELEKEATGRSSPSLPAPRSDEWAEEWAPAEWGEENPVAAGAASPWDEQIVWKMDKAG